MKSYWSRKQLEALGEPINPEAPTRLSQRVGGGGKGTQIQAPDYTGAAQAQAASSAKTTAAQTAANRPNINTPFGTQSWTNTPTFDQAGFDTATANYAKTAVAATGATAGHYQNNGYDGDGNSSQTWVPGTDGTAASNSAGAAPTRADYTGADNWTQTTTLSPQQQAALDSQMKIQQQRTDYAGDLMPKVKEDIARGVDYNNLNPFGMAPTASKFQDMSNADRMAMPSYDRGFVQDIQNQALDYMRPDMQQSSNALESKLYAQGLTPGSTAYETATRRLNDQQSRDKYNALNTAMSQGTQMFNSNLSAQGQDFNQKQSIANMNNQNRTNEFSQNMSVSNYNNTLRQQQIAEQTQRQLQSLNVVNALLTGQQVGMPQMPSFSQASAAQPTNYMGAANATGQMNAQNASMQNASANSLTNGLFNMGGMAAGAFAFSDRRLKFDIKRIGKLGKFNLYSYRYVGSKDRHEGVMADEVKKVMPAAVMRHRNGFDTVNYSMIGA